MDPFFIMICLVLTYAVLRVMYMVICDTVRARKRKQLAQQATKASSHLRAEFAPPEQPREAQHTPPALPALPMTPIQHVRRLPPDQMEALLKTLQGHPPKGMERDDSAPAMSGALYDEAGVSLDEEPVVVTAATQSATGDNIDVIECVSETDDELLLSAPAEGYTLSERDIATLRLRDMPSLFASRDD